MLHFLHAFSSTPHVFCPFLCFRFSDFRETVVYDPTTLLLSFSVLLFVKVANHSTSMAYADYERLPQRVNRTHGFSQNFQRIREGGESDFPKPNNRVQ